MCRTWDDRRTLKELGYGPGHLIDSDPGTISQIAGADIRTYIHTYIHTYVYSCEYSFIHINTHTYAFLHAHTGTIDQITKELGVTWFLNGGMDHVEKSKTLVSDVHGGLNAVW